MEDNLSKLRRILAKRFDEGELRTLCFDLRAKYPHLENLDYDNLSGEGPTNKARELIAYLSRHDSLPQLIEVCRGMRSDIPWDDVAKVIEGIPPGELVPQESDILRKELSKQVRWGWIAVVPLAIVAIVLFILFQRGRWPTASPTHTPTPTQTHTPTPTQAHTPAPTQAPTPTPTLTAIEPISPTNIPTPALPVVEIVYVEYAPEGPDTEGEYIQIRNTTEVAQDLTAWAIEDSNGHTFRFEAFVLEPGASVRVWTKVGEDTQEDLYWGRESSVWTNTGDTATLKDYRGQVVATYTYPQ